MTPTLAPPARRLEPADIGWAKELLAAASTHHPVLDYCCTGPTAPAQRAWLLEQVLRYGLRHGRVYTNANSTALAVWLGPGYPAITWWQVLRAGLLPAVLWRFPWAGVQRLRHLLGSTAWLRRQTVAGNGHFYLLALAVRPGSRGHGEGRRLLQATLAAMQATQTACYFDTQLPDQLPFFQRLGFQLMGQAPMGSHSSGPTTWGLLRSGRAA